jgi:hypothetical protein
MRTNIDAKALLNQKNYILKPNRITAVEIDGIKQNIRSKIRDHTEDQIKRLNGDNMDKKVMEHWTKRDQECNNTGFGMVENNKPSCAEEEQNTLRKKLKEDLQIMWHKVRLLKMSEREKLPKRKKQITDKAAGRNEWSN